MKKILIIGCGSIGKRHLSNFVEVGGCEIVGADSREDRLQEIKDQYGVEKTYTDYLEALKNESIDGVVVACPPHIHVKVCNDALDHGCHLFVEKPLAHDLEGVQELADRCKELNKVGFVAYCHRFIPYSQKFKEIIESGQIGKPVTIRMEWGSYLPDWHPWEDYRTFYMAKKEQGGGALLDESHGVDLLRWWFGEVQSVSAIIDQVSDLEISSDDVAALLLRFKSGAVATANFDLCRREPKIFVEVIGTEGMASWDRMQHEIKCYSAEKKTWETMNFTKDDLMGMYPSETEHFLNCIDGKEESLVDLHDGAKTMGILVGAFESTESGARVQLP
ncbi:MAG: Gfo/Idh/MocA family oxidoreductase [Verrucomicrobiota bacterium]